MGTDHFCDKRIKTTNQFTSGIVVMTESSFNQCSRVSRVHLAKIASTLSTKTARHALRLPLKAQKIVTARLARRSSALKEAQGALLKTTKGNKQ
jgi:hypothetical protein